MRKTLSIDLVVRREIKQPTLLANAVLVLDFIDDLVEAFRDGIITTYVPSLNEKVRARPLTPAKPEFWLYHQIDAPEYIVTGRGIVTDRYWMNVPSYSDVLVDAAQAKRWLFRRKLTRLFTRLTKPGALPPKASSVEVKEAIARAVDDHIKGVAMKPEDVFVKSGVGPATEPIQKPRG